MLFRVLLYVLSAVILWLNSTLSFLIITKVGLYELPGFMQSDTILYMGLLPTISLVLSIPIVFVAQKTKAVSVMFVILALSLFIQISLHNNQDELFVKIQLQAVVPENTVYEEDVPDDTLYYSYTPEQTMDESDIQKYFLLEKVSAWLNGFFTVLLKIQAVLYLFISGIFIIIAISLNQRQNKR